MRFAKIYFALLRHIDRLIAISEDTSREAKENGFADKTVNIPNGVLIPEGNTGLISKPEKVLFLGKLSKQKGADIFVEAAGLNPDSQFRFIVVGDGPLFNILKKNSADNVFFEGGTNQPEKYLLDRKTVFALPSRGEGLSNSLLEAMAYGLPSIISEDVSGAHDLAGKELLNAGLFSAHENLILIKPENPYSLSGALKYLGDNPHYAQQISEKSREYVKNKFSIDLVSERLESLYRQIINQ
jgi:glycosyltransferase involved in cell wall biosynthesis